MNTLLIILAALLLALACLAILLDSGLAAVLYMTACRAVRPTSRIPKEHRALLNRVLNREASR